MVYHHIAVEHGAPSTIQERKALVVDLWRNHSDLQERVPPVPGIGVVEEGAHCARVHLEQHLQREDAQAQFL